MEKHKTIIDGVSITRIGNYSELYTGINLSGARLEQWKERNKEAIEQFEKDCYSADISRWNLDQLKMLTA